MNFDEKVRFVDGVSLFDENDATSIQPITNNERVVDGVLSRPDENLRRRTEVLRAAVEDLKYRSDYGVFLAQSLGRFRLNAVSASTWTIEIDAAELTPGLTILPALVTGAVSGGRVDPTIALSGARVTDPATPNKYYLGVLGTNDLWIFASTAHTGQRAYADGTDMNNLSVKSIGGNNISVLLRPDTALSAHEVAIDTVSGNPTRHISIRYGDGTTLAELIAAVNNDRTGVAPPGGPSQDSQAWGIADMIRIATTAPTSNVLTGVNLLDTGAVPIQMQGAADAESYTVESFASFFGTTENRLQDGESIALSFTPGSVEAAPAYGGRRQSIVDRPADRAGTPAVYATADAHLFNTGRFPERIPGAIPIGKCFANQFVFIDGTVLSCPAWAGSTTNGPWVRLGQNAPFILALAASTGAATIGTAATSNWNATASLLAQAVADRHVPAGTVQSALEAIVTQIGKISSGSSPADSGSRRVGVETVVATATTPNGGLQPTEGSLFEVLSQYLNDVTYGLNARISQWGHKLRGPVGISKDYATEAPTGGADHAIAILDTMGDISTNTATIENRALVACYPIEWNAVSGTDEILLEEEVDGVVTKNWWLHLSSTAAVARLPYLGSRVPIGVTTTPTGGSSTAVPNIIVTLSGFVPGAGKTDTNGMYYLEAYDNPGTCVSLSRMDGLGFTDLAGATPSLHPDFSTGDFTKAKLTFNSTLLIGTDRAGQKIRSFHAGYAPFMNVAFQDANTALAEATVVTGSPNPPKRLRLTPTTFTYTHTDTSKAVLNYAKIDFYDAGGVVQRTSDNILKTLDKNALDGNETGSMVDATVAGSHDHASTYAYINHGHTLCSDNALMVAHDSETGSSFGTAPTLAVVDAVATVYPNVAVFEIPTAVMGFTTAYTTGHAIFEMTLTLVSASGTGAMSDMSQNYSLRPYWRDTTVGTPTSGWNPSGVGGETIFPYDTSISDAELVNIYITNTGLATQRVRRTFAFRLPDLAPLQPTTEVAGYIGFELLASGPALDRASSTVSIRHVLTYYDPN